MGELLAFGPRGTAIPTIVARDDVFVVPSDLDGGSWAVVQFSPGCDEGAFIAGRFAMDDAVAVAKDHAARVGARFAGVAF